MARQKELPNTRRADESAPPPSNDELDKLCEAIGKSKRRRTRAGQDVKANTIAALSKMVELGFDEYPWVYDGVKRTLKVSKKLIDFKEKTTKRRPDDEDDDEGES